MTQRIIPLIEIAGLELEIAGKKLLNGISFQIAANERLALVGESGSGKSLTALSILGLHPKNLLVYAEKMNFKEKSLIGLDEKNWREIRTRKIGMIFQEPQSSLNPSMRCGKQLKEVLNTHTSLTKEQQRKKIEAALREVQLNDNTLILEAYPHALSGGQKQRLMIAMALLCEPNLLIADEPTTALDVTVQKDILELLLKLQKKHGMSILFISHDLKLVKDFAQRVIVMKEGEILEENNTDALFDSPKHSYTKGLLFARPTIEFRYKRLPTLEDFKNDHFEPQTISIKDRSKRLEKLYLKKPLLNVSSLQKTHNTNSLFGFSKKKTPAISDFSFSLFPGETLGLVGASGSGKSTLGRALIYLDPPEKGTIEFEGTPLNEKNISSYRKEIQFIFQDPYAALHPQKTLGKVIGEAIQIHQKELTSSEVQNRVISLLDQTGLGVDFLNRYPHELSGGQRQRVVIARALAPQPKLVICDECVAALDISVQAQVLNLLNKLKKEFNLSYLFISHDLTLVKYMSDRVMVIDDGKIIELQEADELYQNPKSIYTKRLIEALH